MLLQPDVQCNKEITATHFLDFEFGDSRFPIGPAYGDCLKGEATRNGFQRQLYREVEVVGKEGLNSDNHFPAVRFEGVGDIVVFQAEQEFDEPICQSVEYKFMAWIVVNGGTMDKP